MAPTPCPQDPRHGLMWSWSGEEAAWYCPHRGHTGSCFYDLNLQPAGNPELNRVAHFDVRKVAKAKAARASARGVK